MPNETSRFRKKYSIAVAAFVCGTVMAFLHQWTAGEYTIFVSTILGIFGAADLIDKDKFRNS